MERRIPGFPDHRRLADRWSWLAPVQVLEKTPELAEGPVVTGQERPDRRVERLGDLLESKTSDVPEVDDLAVRVGEAIERLLKSCRLRSSGLRIRVGLLAARHEDERVLLGRNRLSPPTPHLVSKPVHGDPHHPRLEPTALLVGGQGADDGAERGLNDLLRKVVVATLRPDDRVHSRRTSLDDLSPRILIASGGPGDERGELLGIEVVHARDEV